MNNILKIVVSFVLAVIVTSFIFYYMSWYSFATLPTKIVFLRMVFSTIILTMVILGILYMIKKIKK
ncbi:MAG: hypothetical protein PHS24_00480 [Bacilli bacterium]|nr:hypothetical protein [Bacilli bacterium]MDD4705676.1 hypothetical protein [Bacilli bacterium]